MSRPIDRQGGRQLFLGYIAMTGVAIIWGAPLLWMLSTALRDRSEVFTSEPRWIPNEPTVDAFGSALADYPLLDWLRNSLTVACITTILSLIVSVLAAYPLARHRFRGRGVLIVVILATFLIPFEIHAVPMFLGLAKLGIVDSIFSLAVPPVVSAFNVFLLMQFFKGIPYELEHAATIDGASRFRILVSILLPLSKPALVTVAIFTFATSWNSFFWPLIVTSTDETRTLPAGLATLVAAEGAGTDFTVLAAASVVSAVPAVAFFLAFQRYFVRGIATTGFSEL